MKQTLFLSKALLIYAMYFFAIHGVQGQNQAQSTSQSLPELNPDWENPEVFQRNQVEPHATLMPFQTRAQALEGTRKLSPMHFSLNGSWKFHWAENPDQAPEDFYKENFVRGNWRDIDVPSNWQMQGFGYPMFRNIGLPFGMDPPGVPDDFNPVGSYYRTFTLPSDWDKNQVFLHFEGVQSASYVWVNGKEVGYNQGGMEPAEYNITKYLKKGQNSLAVRVLRYCDGTYMEDQDTWRLSGIYRDVYLMATPQVHIRDFYITTDLDERYKDADLSVQLELANFGKKAARDHKVRFSLYDHQDQMVPGASLTHTCAEVEPDSSFKDAVVLELSNPRKWSAEYPYLYTLVMELLDKEDVVIEILSNRVGFREVEIRDQAILVNGVPIKFNGVNSHMLHPKTGHAMDVETMRKDLYLMKQFNINCVRTSHYPPNVEYLELADELGIYVVDETGDEAHAYIHISHLPQWREQYLDRMRKMVYRDRNHPSVVIWSAGNESGSGDNLCALMEEGRKIDPSRPGWLYGGNRDEDPLENPIKCEDIVGPRYLQPFRLEQRFAKSDDPRPSFMDEYIAATGNSLGGLDEYWDLIYAYPRLTGGAIWDWVSQGMEQEVLRTRDDSPAGIQCVFMNKAHLERGEKGQALYLSGHDDWLEVARDPALDITGSALTLSFRIRPETFNGHGYFITKGDYQFGIVQRDKKHLHFYVNTGEKVELEARLPENWEGNWHQVVGIYDGKKLELYLNGKIIGTRSCTGDIINSPYAVNIGKSAEIRDSHRGYLAFASIDEVRIFNRVIDPQALENGDEELRSKSLLWLDFETAIKEGSYYSIGIPGRTYGLVWPDRSVQPELWQLKKSPQPVAIEAVNLEVGEFGVENRHHFRNLNELEVRWKFTEDDIELNAGKLNLDLPAGQAEVINIPYKKPELKPGAIYQVLISFHTREDRSWAAAGHEVAWEQFRLPFFRPSVPEKVSGKRLELSAEDDVLMISGEGFTYSFDKSAGTLVSMVVNGREMLSKGPRLNVWRAPLANDLDSWNFWHTDMGYVQDWMGRETANGWRSLGLDRLKQTVDHISIVPDGNVVIHVEASLHANNYTTGFKVFYQYTFTAGGEIELSTRVSPRGYMSRWIPKIGIQLELYPAFRNLEWFGRGPFETYPDRKTGAKIGKYHTTVDEDFVPYIIPQDYGNKTDVYWAKVSDDSGRGIFISGDDTFNTSLQKYSTEALDRAFYPFQLPTDSEVVTLNLDHRVSGVGCTAMSVLNPYRVLPGEAAFTFHIRPLIQ